MYWLKELPGKIFSAILTAVIIIGVVYFGLEYMPDLFASKTEITDLVAEHQLEAIGEFATYQYTYTGVKEKTDTRYLFDSVAIPGTTNSQKYAYNGVIKVGYKVEDMGIHVDNVRKEIYVTLPEAVVLSNTLEQDTSVYEETNNIFNPIKGDAVAQFADEIKAEELEKAKAENLFGLAEEHAKELITNLLAAFEGYTVVFW